MEEGKLQLAIDAAWFKTVYKDGAYYKCPGVHNYTDLHRKATAWFFRKLEAGEPEEAADIFRRRIDKCKDLNEKRVVEWAYMDAAALFINTIMGVKIEGSYIEGEESVPLPEKQVA